MIPTKIESLEFEIDRGEPVIHVRFKRPDGGIDGYRTSVHIFLEKLMKADLKLQIEYIEHPEHKHLWMDLGFQK